jgi:aryl carrier-like protein
LVQLLIEREDSNSLLQKETNDSSIQQKIQEADTETETVVSKTVTEAIKVEKEVETVLEKKVEIKEEKIEIKEEAIEISGDVELEEEIKENPNKRLGDIFLKEKSVNDLLAATSNLENVISNRPVNNIQSAIGINDRFQYIRELFEGKADDFVRTVEELDRMSNLNDAVKFLQINYKWKKNEASLKFVNLVKRRFANE